MTKRVLCALVLCLMLCFGAALAEGETYHYFGEKVWFRFDCEWPEQSFNAAFYTDGYMDGVCDDGEQICGRYAIRSDGAVLLALSRLSGELEPKADGDYEGTFDNGDIIGVCVLSETSEKAYLAALKAAEVDPPFPGQQDDVSLWDYPVFVRVTGKEGIPLTLDSSKPDVVLTVLPKGAVARILANVYDENGDYWGLLMQSGGLTGFAAVEEEDGVYEDIPAGRAKVVKYGKDKGKSVNLRSEPEYADNIILEVPYGKIVETFPLTDGEFTLVYYDHAEGWMTTVRLKPMK